MSMAVFMGKDYDSSNSLILKFLGAKTGPLILKSYGATKGPLVVIDDNNPLLVVVTTTTKIVSEFLC